VHFFLFELSIVSPEQQDAHRRQVALAGKKSQERVNPQQTRFLYKKSFDKEASTVRQFCMYLSLFVDPSQLHLSILSQIAFNQFDRTIPCY